MKYIISTLFFLSSLQSNAQTSSPENNGPRDQHEYSKEITVNGMVCSFCSNSLEKKFKKENAVEKINVDLGKKKVSVKFKDGKNLTDKKLKSIITSSGFSVVDIKTTKSFKKKAN